MTMQPGPLPIDRRYKSSIPANAKPRPGVISGDSTSRRVDYYLRGKHVGWRDWDSDGHLELEVPLRNGQLHGTRYSWYFEGVLTSAEPYYENRPHGVAKQWAMTGELIGTYKMVHGTGIDLWRTSVDGRGEGPYYLSAVLHFQDGSLHGYRWSIGENQRSVNFESHWWQGWQHGIERDWSFATGRLRRGFPKYFVQGEQVTKRRYLAAAAQDSTLPPFREADNKPARKFPLEIQRHLLIKRKE